MRALYRQLNPWQYNTVSYNPREIYRFLLGDEPPVAPAPEPTAAAHPQESLEDLQAQYLPVLQRVSEARLAGAPVSAEDEAAEARYQQLSVARMAGLGPASPQATVPSNATVVLAPAVTLPDDVLDLGETWRALQLLLTGKKEEEAVSRPPRGGVIGYGQSLFGQFSRFIPPSLGIGNSLFAMAVRGGKEISELDRRAHGPARVLSPEEVRSVADALDKISPAKLLEGYEILAESGIPAPDRSVLAQSYARLRHFYVDATANGHAVATCLL